MRSTTPTSWIGRSSLVRCRSFRSSDSVWVTQPRTTSNESRVASDELRVNCWRTVRFPFYHSCCRRERNSDSACNCSDQYFLSESAVARSWSFVCCTETVLLFPFAVNQRAITVPSLHARRIERGRVAVRTFTSLALSQRRRAAASAHASKSVATGTSNVRDLLAS